MLAAALGVYRIAHALAYEDGPFDAFFQLREAVHAKYDGHWLDRGVHCPLCLSFWIALLWPLVPRRAQEWLALAGAVLVLHQGLEAARERAR